MTYICVSCGEYIIGRKIKPKEIGGVTFHYGDCEYCSKKNVGVCEMRDFRIASQGELV